MELTAVTRELLQHGLQYVLGDFNAEADQEVAAPRHELLSSIFDEAGLHEYWIEEPTFYKGISATNPDALYLRPALETMAHLTVLPPGTADHCPMVWTFGVPRCSARPRRQRKWHLEGANFEKYRTRLLEMASLRSASYRTGAALDDYKQFFRLVVMAAKQTLPFHASAKRPSVKN
eukprot:6466110-Amphidinium_carterae.1